MAKSRKRSNGVASASDVRLSTHESTSANEPSANEGFGDRVAMRAYELYLARGGSDGRDFDDWLTAERELAAPRTGLSDS